MVLRLENEFVMMYDINLNDDNIHTLIEWHYVWVGT